MKKKLLTCIVAGAFFSVAHAQETCEECGIGTENPTSTLEIKGCGTSNIRKTLDVKNGNDESLLRVYDSGNTEMKRLKIQNQASVLELKELNESGIGTHWRQILDEKRYRIEVDSANQSGELGFTSGLELRYSQLNNNVEFGINSKPREGYLLNLYSKEHFPTNHEWFSNALIQFQGERAFLGYASKINNVNISGLMIGTTFNKNIIFGTGIRGKNSYVESNEAMRITEHQRVGIGERDPIATLHVGGSVAHNFTSIEAITDPDWEKSSIIICGSGRTLNLPKTRLGDDPNTPKPLVEKSNKGMEYTIKAKEYQIILAGIDGDQIDGTPTYIIPPYGFVKVISNGKGNWYIIGKG